MSILRISMVGIVKKLAVIGLIEISNAIEHKTGVYKGDKQRKDIIPIAESTREVRGANSLAANATVIFESSALFLLISK